MQNKAEERNMNTKTRKRSSSRPYIRIVFLWIMHIHTYIQGQWIASHQLFIYLFLIFHLTLLLFFYSIIALRYFGGGHILQINVHVAILFIHFRGFSLSRCGYVSCIERVISVQGLRDSSRPWCVDSYFLSNWTLSICIATFLLFCVQINPIYWVLEK